MINHIRYEKISDDQFFLFLESKYYYKNSDIHY